ncbi:MAG: Gfo/Idh/MocA family oxidoreductase [Planctomycetes bacterium]|nr:Gfo/Idh/MocA family oxidoreductase [Planctomycetota bacterium]
MGKRAIVVGCGGMGRAWMKNVQDNPRCELVGVVDIRAEAAAQAAADHGLPATAAFTDVAKAIKALKPDFVCDITIPEAHCATTVAAHVLKVPTIGEKPLAHSMAAGRKMVAAAKKSRKLAMISQSRRYDQQHVGLRDAIASGVIGEVTTVNCDFYIGAHFGGFRDEMDSPLILDMAIHHFDLVRFFTGRDAKAVYCHEFNPKGSWYRGDVATSAIFEMDKGVVFTYRGSWCAEGGHTSWNGNWRVVGTQGTLLLENDKPAFGQRVKPGGKTGFHSEHEDIPIATPTVNGGGIAGSLNEFLDALEAGKRSASVPQCQLADNLKSLAMVFAAIRSSGSGRRVPVSL